MRQSCINERTGRSFFRFIEQLGEIKDIDAFVLFQPDIWTRLVVPLKTSPGGNTNCKHRSTGAMVGIQLQDLCLPQMERTAFFLWWSDREHTIWKPATVAALPSAEEVVLDYTAVGGCEVA